MAYSLNGSNGNSIVHPPVNNSEAEFADLKNHPYIRLFRAGKQNTDEPMLEPHPNDPGGSTVAVQGWTPATTADGIDRVDFSSMCYFFGRNIHVQLDIPIGLIGTYWGGTADELWSSPDALDKCLALGRFVPFAAPISDHGREGAVVAIVLASWMLSVGFSLVLRSTRPLSLY